jgi:uncharacterized protein YodC (DUF2158 family)
METEFEVGDVVQLKSGGPKMTIENIGKYGMGSTKDEAKCVWFDGTKRNEALFELAALRIAPPVSESIPTKESEPLGFRATR